MKKHLLMPVLCFVLLCLVSCASSDDDDDSSSEKSVYSYSGSASEGDVVTFSIDQDNLAYSYTNETTGSSGSGSYTVMDDNRFEGIYQVATGSDYFYAVELDNKILAANFNTGNATNEISFGISSAFDNTGKTDQIAGDYLWIQVDNSSGTKKWGLLEVADDLSWEKEDFTTDSSQSPLTLSAISTPYQSGTSSVDGTHKERLNVLVNGTSSIYQGFVYASDTSAAYLLDLGEGNGFMLGLKAYTPSLTDIAGDYKFVDVWSDGDRGAGCYTITTSSSAIVSITYNHIMQDGTSIDSGSFSNFQTSSGVVKNVFMGTPDFTSNSNQLYVVFVICDEMIIHFMFEQGTGNFVSYGAGARI